MSSSWNCSHIHYGISWPVVCSHYGICILYRHTGRARKGFETMRQAKMTRVHFQFIADVVASLPDDPVREVVINRFARSLKSTNPAFNTGRFIDACREADACRKES